MSNELSFLCQILLVCDLEIGSYVSGLRFHVTVLVMPASFKGCILYRGTIAVPCKQLDCSHKRYQNECRGDDNLTRGPARLRRAPGSLSTRPSLLRPPPRRRPWLPAARRRRLARSAAPACVHHPAPRATAAALYGKDEAFLPRKQSITRRNEDSVPFRSSSGQHTPPVDLLPSQSPPSSLHRRPGTGPENAATW